MKRPVARKRAAPREVAPLPSLAALRRFLQEAPGRVGKTEIARHFGLSSDQRPALRELLAQLQSSGGAVSAGRRGVAAVQPTAAPAVVVGRRRRHPDADAAPPSRRPARTTLRLPETTPVEVFGTDPDGDPLARPLQWDAAAGRPPIVYMRPERPGQPALAPGERVLARVKPIGPGKYEGRTFKRIGGGAPARILGVFEDGRITPTDRRSRADWQVAPEAAAGAANGDLVLAEPLPGRPLGPRPARVLERIGRAGDASAVSLICIHTHRIPDTFPPEAIAAAERAGPVGTDGREDLTAIPLVTIDGEDARDFDDAVWAEADGAGWRVLVAIADVAHYVRPDDPLDREAALRGNSVYFPDRVVPMLPEALSNGWCSLKPHEPRGCLYVDMRFDAGGTKLSHRFGRGRMRSAARLTYDAVQDAADAGQDAQGVSLAALYGAFRALLAARGRRGTLELDLPERRVRLGADGRVLAVEPRPRRDSHRLIEEFMVAANVCAAEELERLRQPCMYRIHDRPSDLKLEGLRDFLRSLDLALPPSNHLRPADFARLLDGVRGAPHERLVHETVLRSQSQAAYAPDNIGHFGLALPRYAHFTSPIRRYADLLVHRALIRGLKLGDDGLTEREAGRMTDLGEAITGTERRAALAERDAVDRYLAAFLADRVGQRFEARVSGVTRFGLFVTLEGNGASGIVPLGSLPDDRWTQDEAGHRLRGTRSGTVLALGQPVEVLLRSATPLTGSLSFELLLGVPDTPRRGRRPRS